MRSAGVKTAPTALRPSHSRRWRTPLLRLAQVGFVVGIIALWAFAARDTELAFTLGSPSRVLAYIVEWAQNGSLWGHLAATLAAAAVGWIVGMALGSLVGIWVGLSPRLSAMFGPFFAFWLAFPRIVYYPFFAIALGYTVGSRMVHVVFVIIFLVIINTAAGIREVDRSMVANVRMLGGSPLALLRDVYVPSALVWVMTSARFTAGIALQSAIVAEFIGANSGIGYLTVLGQNRFDVNFVWAAIALVVVVAFGLDRVLDLLQRTLTRWNTP